MDPCPWLAVAPEVGGGAKNPPDVEEGGANNPLDVGSGASLLPVLLLVDTDPDPVPIRADTALVDAPRMRTEFVLLAMLLTCI